MISDPIILKSQPDQQFFDSARQAGKSEIFFTLYQGSRDKIGLIYLLDAERSNPCDFHVKFVAYPVSLGQDGGLWVNCKIRGDNSVTKEEFVDTLARDYPDYLGWLLFHPGWL